MQNGFFLTVLVAGLVLGLIGWYGARRWYFRIVARSQSRVRHQDGRMVPLKPPKWLVGNLAEVYQADNQLGAYHQFHKQLGEIVQIFWMWRQQISVANVQMAHRILVTNQKHYRKFPPNQIIQRLYGASVLTNHGPDWQRQRTLMQGIFSPQRMVGFHDIFVDCSEQLVAQWLAEMESAGGSVRRDVYPDLTALFLDIVGRTALGVNFEALSGDGAGGMTGGRGGELLASIRFILKQSTYPPHQFIAWWRWLPLPSNRQLADAFALVDDFLYGFIHQRRAAIQQGVACSESLLDLLLQATESGEGELLPLTDKEVRDNLLAIIVNGYETVATSAGMTLDLLARNPEHLGHVQDEVDRVFSAGAFTPSCLEQLTYLKSVIVESLRLCPPMAGLQRISTQPDTLAGWAIPAEQVVGIPLYPLHCDAQVYGDSPEQFRPQRYVGLTAAGAARRGCPINRFLTGRDTLGVPSDGRQAELPLTFGDGARRCLGEAFALHEMTVVLAMLVHRFTLEVRPGDEAVTELGKFGLFISMVPKAGVTLTMGDRAKCSQR